MDFRIVLEFLFQTKLWLFRVTITSVTNGRVITRRMAVAWDCDVIKGKHRTVREINIPNEKSRVTAIRLIRVSLGSFGELAN